MADKSPQKQPQAEAVTDRRQEPVAPTTDQASTDAKPKRGPGAPVGNKNRQTHGLRAERSHRDAHLRRAERDVREVLRSYALESDPMAKLVGRQLRRLEAAAGRLEERLGKRGWFTNRSEPAPAFAAYIGVVDRLLGEARRMLERLAGAQQPEGDHVYVACFADGEPLSRASTIGAGGEGLNPSFIPADCPDNDEIGNPI